MKAIIPAAGFGTRLRPHTYTQPKALLQVAGKPILAHIIDELVAVGVDEIVLVVGYLGEPIEPPSNLAVIGAYLIHDTRALRRALERMVTEDRRMKGEYWLADAMQLMIDAGERMKTFRVDHWYDCGTVDALLQANRDLLKLMPPAVSAGIKSTVISPSYLSPSAV